MIIRQAKLHDAALIWASHSASIQELCASHYTPEQIQEWVAGLNPQRYIGAMELFEFLVAETAQGIAGLCMFDVKNGELNALYVAPWATRQGIGKALLAIAEDHARGCGLAQLRLNATLNAVSFYEATAYKRLADSMNRLPSGVALPCVRMMKALSTGLVEAQ